MNAWKTLLQGVVENLAYIRRLTKNAARHRYGTGYGRTHVNAWKISLQGVVENLAYIRRLTKNAARHRYGKHVRGSTRREATQDDGGEPSQFGGGIGEEVAA